MPIDPGPLIAIYLAFVAKHLLADFVLQTGWMARGKEQATGWAAPLFAHAGCHAALTLLIALAVEPRLWWLAAIDLPLHAGIDRAKGLLGRGLTFEEPGYWRLFGADQALHQVTHFAFVLALAAG